MNLKIVLPSHIFMDEEVVKITGESPLGGFTLKPKHIDMATAIAPGIMSYETTSGATIHLAVDQGIAIKRGSKVIIAANNAVRDELGRLEEELRRMLTVSDELERSAQTAVARLEAGFVRRFLEFGQ